MADLLTGHDPNPRKPRQPRQWRMHVVDAGMSGSCKVIRFRCKRCNHDTGWIVDERTVSENRQGLPCPWCNRETRNG